MIVVHLFPLRHVPLRHEAPVHRRQVQALSQRVHHRSLVHVLPRPISLQVPWNQSHLLPVLPPRRSQTSLPPVPPPPLQVYVLPMTSPIPRSLHIHRHHQMILPLLQRGPILHRLRHVIPLSLPSLIPQVPVLLPFRRRLGLHVSPRPPRRVSIPPPNQDIISHPQPHPHPVLPRLPRQASIPPPNQDILSHPQSHPVLPRPPRQASIPQPHPHPVLPRLPRQASIPQPHPHPVLPRLKRSQIHLTSVQDARTSIIVLLWDLQDPKDLEV